jgi:hypothetical protein
LATEDAAFGIKQQKSIKAFRKKTGEIIVDEKAELHFLALEIEP